MEIYYKQNGFLLIILALIYTVFPIYFNWKNAFAIISSINKQMIWVHTFFIALTVFLLDVLLLPKNIIKLNLIKNYMV